MVLFPTAVITFDILTFFLKCAKSSNAIKLSYVFVRVRNTWEHIYLIIFWFYFVHRLLLVTKISDHLNIITTLWRHQMELFFALLTLWCPFVVSLNKRMNKHLTGRSFETAWRSFDVAVMCVIIFFGDLQNQILFFFQPHIQSQSIYVCIYAYV